MISYPNFSVDIVVYARLEVLPLFFSFDRSEMVDGQPEKQEEKKEEKPVAKTGRRGGPRAMPSISVIQKFEVCSPSGFFKVV